MKNLLFIIIVFIVVSCVPSTNNTDVISDISIPPANWDDYYRNYNYSIDVPESDFIMVPLGTVSDNKKSKSYSIRSDVNNSYFKNYVFCNLKNGDQHLLTEDCSYSFESAIPVYFPYHKEKEGAVLYYLRNHDLNNDGIIDYNDNRRLYISDVKGKNFRAVTPENMQIDNYFFPKDSSMVILYCTTDSDNDMKFTSKDKSSLYFFEWPFSNNLKPLLNNDTETAIQKMIESCNDEKK